MLLPKPTERATDRRASERETFTAPAPIQLTLYSDDGQRFIVAQMLSISYSGLGIVTNQPLSPGIRLSYMHPVRSNQVWGRVAWCKRNENETFEHGVANEPNSPVKTGDHYAFLQVSPTAEPEAIGAAYERLARRYHPNNTRTGDAALFERTQQAYYALADPVERTVYDAQRSSNKSGDGGGAKVERNRAHLIAKRNEMLDMLYWRRFETPFKPIITMHEFETLLNSPKEQLEFNLWYLRDRGLIARSDNACFVITSEGVGAVEAANCDTPESGAAGGEAEATPATAE